MKESLIRQSCYKRGDVGVKFDSKEGACGDGGEVVNDVVGGILQEDQATESISVGADRRREIDCNYELHSFS